MIKLQSRPFTPVHLLANKFSVSKRTIYRDLKALEQAGIPLTHHEEKGYGIMAGYNIPPVMFTEAEANALILAEKIISKSKDKSLIREFNHAVEKIKSVLRNTEKEKADFLAERTIIGKNWKEEKTSDNLSHIQKALTNFRVLRIEYLKETAAKPSSRTVEPFAIYHNTSEHWVLIAWCRLRSDFRSFRLDRMENISLTEEQFTPHQISLKEYTDLQKKKYLQEDH